MLAKKHRISELFFTQYYKKSAAVHTPHFFIKKTTHSGGEGKFAVIVAKKTIKRSVDRNAVKRLIYSKVDPKIQKNLYFITVKKDITNIPASEWAGELQTVLS
jgi:ribonuclease P protein component